MRRLFERMSDLEKRIGEVELEAKMRFQPKEPQPAPPPKFQFPPGYYLPENRRRFEELDAKVERGPVPCSVNVRALSPEQSHEWGVLLRMGFKSRTDPRPGE